MAKGNHFQSAAKIGLAGPILAAKVVQGRLMLAKISAEIGQARQILRETHFETTGQRAIGKHLATSVEVVI